MTKRKQASKITKGHKISLATLSVLGVVAGWNTIGRVESSNKAAQAVVLATPEPIVAGATPWPTIAPIADIPRLDVRPLPTLAFVAGTATQNNSLNVTDGEMASSVSNLAMPSMAPLPTLAPLPTMPEYVPPPPPAPVQVAAAPPPPSNGGDNNVSAGS